MSAELIPIIDQLIVMYQDSIKDVEQCDNFTDAYKILKYKDPKVNVYESNQRRMSGGICYALLNLESYTYDLQLLVEGLVFDGISRDDEYMSDGSAAFYGPAPCHLNKYPLDHYNGAEDLITICLRPRLERLEYIKSKLIDSAE